MMNEYYHPQGIISKGSGIKWCSRAHGGKRCMLCRHYAEFSEWSAEWMFYYLYAWWDCEYKYPWTDKTPRDATCIMRESKWWYVKQSGQSHWSSATTPAQYRTPGLVKYELDALFRNGCKENRKCKCVKINQRANWYCPTCFNVMEKMAKHKQANIHDLMIGPVNDLKEEILILTLSGCL